MTPTISIFVPGEPKAQPRPRAFVMGGRARVYNPSQAEGWKSSIAIAIRELIPPAPLEGPLRVDLEFVFPRPKKHYRTGKRSHELRPDAPHWHTSKPDRDNCEKSVTDCLKHLGVIADDCQVCDGTVLKRYPALDERPGCYIHIEPASLFYENTQEETTSV